MTVEVVTYANKKFGLFDKLVDNEHGVPIKVLGMGTEWTGFNDKYRGVLAYLKKHKSDDDIIVFVDGFDTLVNKDLSGFEEKFRATGAGIVVSKDVLVSWVPTVLGRHINRTVFGTCDGKHAANTGMYVGYARDIKTVLAHALDMSCEDDQVNMNALCSAYDFISVDEDCVFFENVGVGRQKSSSAYFVSFPGTPSLSRVHRAAREYAQFFRVQFVVLAIIALAVSPRTVKPRIIIAVAAITAAYVAFADKSCALEK